MKKRIPVIKWTEQNDNFLKDNYGKIPAREIAKILNISKYNVYDRAEIFGLSSNIYVPSMLGKHHSEESKNKIRFANSGERNYNYGKHLSNETKEKMSIGLKGKPSWSKGKTKNTDKRLMQTSLKIKKFHHIENETEEEHKKKYYNYDEKWRKKNRKKANAYQKAQYYIPLKDKCEFKGCNQTKNLHRHHHKGYEGDNALDVVILCAFHHKQAHKEIKNANNS